MSALSAKMALFIFSDTCLGEIELMLIELTLLFSIFALIPGLNKLSYVLLKNRILKQGRWDLNICCGNTDVGGVNADIVQHRSDIPNFIKIDDIYRLPFKNLQFNRVLCSHTLEHVDDPVRFDLELRRIGKSVHYILPPLWDIAAVCNLLEHKWIFLTFKKEHTRLPVHVRLPFSRPLQRRFHQRVKA
jgi:SAM-dependent methyltransferase